MHYPINEIFQTIQGEGVFTGLPAIFVRLQGCPVGCPWCDTMPPPDAEPDGAPQQQQQQRQATACQVFTKQAVEHAQPAQVEQQVPQIGVGQIACYDAPPFTLGYQGAIEGELVIRHGEKEQQTGE